MRTKTRRTRRPTPPAFTAFRNKLRRRLISQSPLRISRALVVRALDEAEQSARATGFPHLFFPELANEQLRRLSQFLAPATSRPAINLST